MPSYLFFSFKLNSLLSFCVILKMFLNFDRILDAGLPRERGVIPLKVSFDDISCDIIRIHDPQAKRQDVDSLYSSVSNIVKSSTQVADHSIDFKVDNAKYIFLYRSANDTVSISLGQLIDNMKDLVIQKTRTSIEYFDFGTADETAVSEFWDIINHSFYNNNVAVKNPAKILYMKEKTERILMRKGPYVLLIDYGIGLMTTVLQREEWKTHLTDKGFEGDFIKYYERERPEVTECSHVKVDDVRSRDPKSITCPDCDMTMVIESVLQVLPWKRSFCN